MSFEVLILIFGYVEGASKIHGIFITVSRDLKREAAMRPFKKSRVYGFNVSK